MYRFWIALMVGAALATGAVAAGKRIPWRQRIGRGVENFHLTAHKNTPVNLWPEEPISPQNVDQSRFKSALGMLCGRMPPSRLDKYTAVILEEAKRFEVDPFELCALVYDQSHCWPLTPKRYEEIGLYGLTRIPFEMHARQMQRGEYIYYIAGEKGGLAQRSLKLDKYPFNKWKAAGAESNLYFAAAFLSIFHLQDKTLDGLFDSAPHRHPISHWFYGDAVREAEPENRVLAARRRMLEYYDGKSPASVGAFREVEIVSPLDGAPRLVVDYFGNKRGKKDGEGHRGIDIDGMTGEPVRAIAAGRVAFAGVDLNGAKEHRLLTVKESALIPAKEMGPGGLYVSINHKNDFGTIYMHLDSIAVEYNQEVQAGQVIGTLGRSGTQSSGPHLHLEFRLGTDRADPAPPLAPALVNQFAR